MELTQSKISEIISNYTSSSKGFITLQSLIMNSLMGHERDLFVKRMSTSNVMAFVPVVGIVMALSFLFVFHAVAVVISIRFFQAWSVVKAKNMQGFQSILHQRAYSGQIDGNSEAIDGRIYSKQQVSYLSNSYREDVE